MCVGWPEHALNGGACVDWVARVRIAGEVVVPIRILARMVSVGIDGCLEDRVPLQFHRTLLELISLNSSQLDLYVSDVGGSNVAHMFTKAPSFSDLKQKFSVPLGA